MMRSSEGALNQEAKDSRATNYSFAGHCRLKVCAVSVDLDGINRGERFAVDEVADRDPLCRELLLVPAISHLLSFWKLMLDALTAGSGVKRARSAKWLKVRSAGFDSRLPLGVEWVVIR
jgi:hypothetical protein